MHEKHIHIPTGGDDVPLGPPSSQVENGGGRMAGPKPVLSQRNDSAETVGDEDVLPPKLPASPRTTYEDQDDDDDDTEPPPPLLSKARQVALVVTTTGAAFLNILGIQATVIALPTIGRALDIPESRQQWIVSAYSLTFGCFLLLWGRLADVYGRRTIFIAGSAWLAITMIVLPFVHSEVGFDLVRGLQGLGAAANVPTAIGILAASFPPGRSRNYALAAYGSGPPLGSAIGHVLGGVICQYLDWRWMFWIMAIIAACLTAAGVLVIPRQPPVAPGLGAGSAVDWIGAILVTSGLIVLLFALTEGNTVGWSTGWIAGLIVVSVAILAVFVAWQYAQERPGWFTSLRRRPLVKLSIFAKPGFAAGLVITALFYAAFNVFVFLATYFYQDYLGLSVIQTTLRFIPLGVPGAVTALATGYLLTRVPAIRILIFGLACTCGSIVLFAAPIPPHLTYWAWGFPAMVLAVVGVDTSYPCLIIFTSQNLPPEDQAFGGGLVTAAGQIGQAIGLAIAIAVQTAVTAAARGGSEAGLAVPTAGDDALLKGLRAGQWFLLGLAGTALAISCVAFRSGGFSLGSRNRKRETARTMTL